ncbi:type 1 glutamine amidotransferase [Streptomyces sp. NRRL WC-3549]|uniref:type 1 glutamine amidotransferase n=1 Tax=Streptomyces sp. NRRL WC-3549 TaxID=1463925 RepID=UPI0009E6B538|nr:type 1 glutamine amidotransferase [Streptomyces sp. NRRL WC-3549]
MGGTATAATALVIQHGPGEGLGRWRGWLEERGVTARVVPAHEGAVVPDRLEHPALVVLGGGYLPDDDVRAPWLPATRALVRQALTERTPVFGICLGGQMLAQVAGGEVRGEHGTPEFGSTRLGLRPEAEDDPLFHGLPAHPRAIENHVDAVTALPPGAHWLVRGDDCPYQAFRVGSSAWGVQFHPETTAGRVLRWDPGRLLRYGAPAPELLHARALRDEPAATTTWRTVAHRFAGLALAAAGERAAEAPAGGHRPGGRRAGAVTRDGRDR